MIIVSVIWLPYDLVQWDTRRVILTNRRSMRTQGLFRKSSFDLSLEQINDIGLAETTVGRFLGYSDLTLYTASDQANETYHPSARRLAVQEGRAGREGSDPRGVAPCRSCPRGSSSGVA